MLGGNPHDCPQVYLSGYSHENKTTLNVSSRKKLSISTHRGGAKRDHREVPEANMKPQPPHSRQMKEEERNVCSLR